MSFWAFIIPILVDLLVKFLTELFKKQTVFSGAATAYRIPAPVDVRAEFVDSVKWKFWLGPHRSAWAGALFDRASFRVANAQTPTGLLNTVSFATEGLASLRPSDLVPRRLGATARNYRILPNGLVKGGTASYALGAGTIEYVASVVAGKWIFTKTYDFKGTYKLDVPLPAPETLKVGQEIHIGPVRLIVVLVHDASVVLSFTIEGQQARGSATIAKWAPLWLLSLDCSAKISGYDIILQVRPA